MNKKTNYILIIIFISLITMPQILYWFVKDYLSADTSENRQLAIKPQFDLKTIRDYPTKYDQYYNDHIPFRNILRTSYANINFLLFNETLSDKVVIGKNEGGKSSTWLFYNVSWDGMSVEEARGNTTFSDNKKEKILYKINENKLKLSEKGIELYYIIIPNKENIYKDKLPDCVKIVDEQSRTDKLAKWLIEDKKVENFIYLKNVLQEAKKERQIYYKGDTHWNDYGAFIGNREIVNKISSNYINEEISISETKKISGDLIDYTNIQGILEDTEYKISFLENNNYTKQEIQGKKNIITITNCENAIYDKTILYVGDSFRTALIQYMSKIYKNVIYMHRDDYEKNMLEEYNPDIVLYEAVERFTESLGNFEF